MIASIRHKGLAALYYDGRTKGVKQSLVKRLRQILALLATAVTVEDMNLPGLKLHQLAASAQGRSGRVLCRSRFRQLAGNFSLCGRPGRRD